MRESKVTRNTLETQISVAINLDGTFLGCKYVMPLLRRNGGAIVNLSSVSGLIGGHNLAAYNASKGGVSLLSKSVALYGARLKPPVRCNAICPGTVETPSLLQRLHDTGDFEKAYAEFTARQAMGRFGRVEEIAALAVYLASDESAFTTGTVNVIDGGWVN